MPGLWYYHLVDKYGIRISAVREKLSAELINEEDARPLNVSMPTAVMCIEEVAFDQGNIPTIIGRRRAITEKYLYVNEIR